MPADVLTRHSRLKRLIATALLGVFAVSGAHAATLVEVFKSPYCGCCGKWVEHMQIAGFKVHVNEVKDVNVERKQLGIPDSLSSCHTARVDGYALEGHVPSEDIQRLLKEKPKALGLTVPGMPASAPGMDGPKMPYETLLVSADGKTNVFAKH